MNHEVDNKNGGEGWYFIGRSYEKVLDTVNATAAYNHVINDYPNCKKVNDAQTRLAGL